MVAVDSSKQLPNFDRVDDGCVMRRCTRRKSANEVRCDIVLGATRRNRVAKHTSTDFPRAVCAVSITPFASILLKTAKRSAASIDAVHGQHRTKLAVTVGYFEGFRTSSDLDGSRLWAR